MTTKLVVSVMLDGAFVELVPNFKLDKVQADWLENHLYML